MLDVDTNLDLNAKNETMHCLVSAELRPWPSLEL